MTRAEAGCFRGYKQALPCLGSKRLFSNFAGYGLCRCVIGTAVWYGRRESFELQLLRNAMLAKELGNPLIETTGPAGQGVPRSEVGHEGAQCIRVHAPVFTAEVQVQSKARQS